MTNTTEKKTQGRRKIDIKKIENLSHRRVTFSKRRLGLFNKASELCILTGAEIAIVVSSIANRVFTFSHPPGNAVINRFLHGDQVPRENSSAVEANMIRDSVRQEEWFTGGKMWWDQGVEEMGLEELEQFGAALDELTMNVDLKSNSFLPVVTTAANLDMEMPPLSEAEAALSLDETLMFWSGLINLDNCK